MKRVVPDYYADFACVAGACRHTCCVGWEIDIDPDSLRRMTIDPAVGLAIAALIGLSSWNLLREAMNLALDAVPARKENKR